MALPVSVPVSVSVSSSVQLTRGCILSLVRGEQRPNAVVQVLDMKRITSQSNDTKSDRYRLELSDGMYRQKGMLASQLNRFVDQGILGDYAIIKIKQTVTNAAAGRLFVVLLEADVLVPTSEKLKIIGNPQPVPMSIIGTHQTGQMGQIGQSGQTGTLPIQQPIQHQSVYQQSTPPQTTPQTIQQQKWYQQQQQPQPQPQPQPPQSLPQQAMMHTQVKTEMANKQMPAYMQRGGAIVQTAQPVMYMPIKSIQPYVNRFTIKARVTAKGEIKEWNNVKGSGRLFSCDLLDNYGDSIRATFFTEAADKFYHIINVGDVYSFSKATVKTANKQFNTTKHNYELQFNKDAEIEQIRDDNSIKQEEFNFVPLNALPNMDANETIDVIGVVTEVQPLGNVVSKKTSKEIPKRVIKIVDATMSAIEVTLWNAEAQKYNEDVLANYPVIAIKSCRVSEWGGRSLSTSFSSRISINPDVPEKQSLQHFWQQYSGGGNFQELSNSKQGTGVTSTGPIARKFMSSIKDEKLGMNSDRPDWLTVRGYVTFIKHDIDRVPWYSACPSGTCKKKVVDQNNGSYFCDKCNREYNEYLPRYILSLVVADHTGGSWVQAYDECATKIIKADARLLNDLKQQGDISAFKLYFQQANFTPWIFKMVCKNEEYQGNSSSVSR